MKQAFLALGQRVFEEDRTMLQAQQKVIDADPSRKMLFFDVDKAPVMYHRLVEKLLAAEAQA